METYKHETKYNIGDEIFAIKHNGMINDVFNKKRESYEIYVTTIKEIKFNRFGIVYNVDDLNYEFKEENIFLKTDKKGLFNRISEIMENNEGK